MDSRRIVFLIHGVGNPKPGDVRRAFLRHAEDLGSTEDDVVELNWNALLPAPVERRRIDHDWLADLARSIQAAAAIGFDANDRRRITRGTARLQDPLAKLLRVVAAFAPMLVLWGLLCLIFTAIRTDVGTPWAEYRFDPASYRAWWRGAAFLGYPLKIGLWPALWAKAAAVWVGFVGILSASIVGLGVIDRRRGSFLASLRRGVLLALSPIVYAAGLPFVMRWSTSIGLMAYLVISTIIGVPTYAERIVSPSTLYLQAEVAWVNYVKWDQLQLTLLVLVPTIAAVVVALVVAAPILKVLADIFRYLGNPTYRGLIHDGLRKQIKDKLAGLEQAHVIVAGHSLGSVIAFDALRSRATVLAGRGGVDLVTGGSPLVRLFHRFFPDDYGRPVTELEALRPSYPGLRWTNVFRPLDYVGGRLSSGAEGIREVCLPQRWRFHINYWGDQNAVRGVRRGLEEQRPPSPGGQVPSVEPRDWDRGLGRFAALTRRWQSIVPVACGLVAAICFAVVEPVQGRAVLDAQIAELRVGGVETPGKLYRVQREVWEGNADYQYTDVAEQFWVRFELAQAETFSVELDERFHDTDAMERALVAYDERQSIIPTDPREVGLETHIVHAVDDPARVHAPAYYRETLFSFWRIIGALAQGFIGALFAVILVRILDALLGPAHEVEASVVQ